MTNKDKFYYAFYKDYFTGEPCHEFVTEIDTVSCEAYCVKTFYADPVELFKLVSQYAKQTGEYLYFEHAGSTREFWGGKLQEYYDYHGPNLHLRDIYQTELDDSEQE